MAEGLNKAILIGNLGMDPELRFTQNNQAILRMRLATSESFMNRNKERQERTEWHTVIVWGNRAEALNKFLTKGSKLCIEGRIQTRQWEDKDNNKRYSTEIVATNIVLLGGRRDGDGSGGDRAYSGGSNAPGGGGAPSGSDAPSGGGDSSGGGYGDDFGDDDIPF